MYIKTLYLFYFHLKKTCIYEQGNKSDENSIMAYTPFAYV